MIARGSRRLAALVCLLGCGCSTMRELPRDQYAAMPERSNVRVETDAGAKHEFERIQVTPDSLTGLTPRPNEGSFTEYETTSMPLASVHKMSVRMIDWYRTGLILGVGAAVVLAAVLSQSSNKSSDSGGGNGPCGPRPCP